ncbi:histidine phosphatase family protein [Sediminibacillus albus]|uniref:2,3-bisphosphoglycerate-dependent phosphoglycerate mutase n=1 Tax=Sediminibacillus albus TaxID=407036 RepID=A0A1G8VRN3_9BACI|nr:histidine phosphatase family protein [Sediminibacillus albus]SDJ68741.1 2,3-bisphosphoglycerate-dependent phosphoglycerate mutase [Sediminibacillus albus]
MKRLFMIRHCNAEGQHKDSPLTKDGVIQAQIVAEFLQDYGYKMDRILSSPFLRAVESIKPYAQRNSLPIEIDERLEERLLSEEPVDDWMDVLEQSFTDMNFKLPGGESSNDASLRAKQLVDEIMEDDSCENVAIVTHGNLLALLLGKYQADIGFAQWKGLTNPDMYLIQKTGGEYIVERIWQDKN